MLKDEIRNVKFSDESLKNEIVPNRTEVTTYDDIVITDADDMKAALSSHPKFMTY